MVAQQLTPEVAQPSVLGEIDPGPGMLGLHREPYTAASPSGDAARSATRRLIMESSFSSDERRHSCGYLRPFELPLKHQPVVFTIGKFNSTASVDAEAGVKEESVAGVGKTSAIRMNNYNFPYSIWPSTREQLGLLKGLPSTRQHDIGEPGIELPRPLVTGSKAFSNFCAGVLMREMFIWVSAINMTTSQYEEHELLRVSRQSAELLLRLVAATDSCLRMLLPNLVMRVARVEQCTGKLHCLLDDPG